MMIQNYQQRQELNPAEVPSPAIAEIAAVYSDGVTLYLPGEDEPTEKHYMTSGLGKFKAGDKVYITEESGTKVVLSTVGAPITTLTSDRADRLTTARTISLTGGVTGSGSFSGASNVSIATTVGKVSSASSADTATRATTADSLTNARTIALTGNVTGSGSFSGGANLSIATSVLFVADKNSPNSRTIEFRVASAGKLQFRSSYYNSNYWYNMDGTQA